MCVSMARQSPGINGGRRSAPPSGRPEEEEQEEQGEQEEQEEERAPRSARLGPARPGSARPARSLARAGAKVAALPLIPPGRSLKRTGAADKSCVSSSVFFFLPN